MCDLEIGIEMSAKTTTEIRDALRSVFRGKPVKQVDLFGSAAREEMGPDSDVDLLVTPSYEATPHDLLSWPQKWKMLLADGLTFSFAPMLKR